MRAQIPHRPGIRVLDGDARALPLPDHSADGAWLSLVIHHIPDLEAAAGEIRRVLRPGAPVLIRQGFPGRGDPADTIPWGFFPETARTVNSFPTAEQVSQAFASAGFRRDALERVPETLISLAEFLDQADSFRRSDTIMRGLTEEEFLRGKEQLRHQTLALVASGQIVHPTVASLPLAQRADIVLIPVTGLPPLQLGLIWCTAHENARIRALAQTAATLSPAT